MPSTFQTRTLIATAALLSLGAYAQAQQLPHAPQAAQARRVQAEPQAAGFIIKFRDGSRTPVAAKAALQGFRAMSEARGHRVAFDREGAFGRRVIRLARHVPPRELAQLARDIQLSDSSIESVEIDHVVRASFTPNDTRWDLQWDFVSGTGGINIQKAWDLSQGYGQRVAVLDTGVRPHADLVGNLLPGYDLITDSSRAGDGGGRDSDASDPGDNVSAGTCGFFEPAEVSSWHGTHVAGTIAAVGNNALGVSGVAPKAKIVPVRVLGKCGGTTSDVADGIVWAVGGTVGSLPKNANPALILNLSLGGQHSCGSTYQDAINYARGLGALIVVAAGNDSEDVSNHAPSNCNGVMAVAATTRAGGRAGYSNFGSGVDIAAPGGDADNLVWSLSNMGTAGPTTDALAGMMGTSMAAPHVAGVAALMMASNSLMKPSDTEYLMKATARSFPVSCSGCGNGIVDAEAAVIAAKGFRAEREPNDTVATAQYLNVFPARVIGTLQAAYPDQVDIYSLNLPAGQGLSTNIVVLAMDFYFSASLELLDATGKLLAKSTLINGKPEINYYNTSGKTMALYVRVKGKTTQIGGGWGDKPYELKMYRNPF
jgi:serine protease